MAMANVADKKVCKFCCEELVDCLDEGLTCTFCNSNVHLRCLKSGGVPGGLYGDIFFIYTCQDCSETGIEQYTRDKMSWLKVLVLVLFHLQARSPGLGRKGYFHWRNHVATLIDQHWDSLFLKQFKRKKKWVGTIAGTLSHFSNFFFKSGTCVVNEPAWWALAYPKLTPNVISNIYSTFTIEKQKNKVLKISIPDRQLFDQILHKYVKNEELLNAISYGSALLSATNTNSQIQASASLCKHFKRKSLLPTLESTSKKLLKLSKNSAVLSNLTEELTGNGLKKNEVTEEATALQNDPENHGNQLTLQILDRHCHYNTSVSAASKMKAYQIKMRLMGGTRNELILSPYSSIYLKPYIRRDTETVAPWQTLMSELQLRANFKNKHFVLPPRAPLDYTYVQPEHIPAINSLCNQFFWPGIDLTECLQYPDFSCVVLYKKLLVAFAFLVPNVTYTENYISFIFTRPGWRNVGIGKFMIYHLIQTSLGKDITLHVSINNPALFLYQKFGFKVESVALYFYEKYIHSGAEESKHAFFCRLER